MSWDTTNRWKQPREETTRVTKFLPWQQVLKSWNYKKYTLLSRKKNKKTFSKQYNVGNHVRTHPPSQNKTPPSLFLFLWHWSADRAFEYSRDSRAFDSRPTRKGKDFSSLASSSCFDFHFHQDEDGTEFNNGQIPLSILFFVSHMYYSHLISPTF